MQRFRLFICALVIAGIGFSQHAPAAILSSIPTNTAPASPANLTTAGTLDWALWNVTSNAGVTSLAPTNKKASVPSLISNLTNVISGNTIRGGAGTIPAEAYTYTDGTSPTSATNATANFVFPFTLDTVGQGLQFTVAGDPTQPRTVQIWASGYQAQGTLTASLAGAADQVLLSQSYPNATPKASTLFTLTFQPDLITDLLTIKFVLTNVATVGSAHVGIQAVAVSTAAIPEPSLVMLGVVGSLGLLIARRSRKVTV